MHVYEALTNVIRTHMLLVPVHVVCYATTLLPVFSCVSTTPYVHAHKVSCDPTETKHLLRLCFTRNAEDNNHPKDHKLISRGSSLSQHGLASPSLYWHMRFTLHTITGYRLQSFTPSIPHQTMSTRLNKIASSLVPTNQVIVKSAAAQLEPSVFGPGVTGVDLTVLLFDGTSLNPHDYLIDLETDSMERYPDIRSYFYWVGELQQDAIEPPPTDLEARKLYDDDLVRRGRLYLKSEKAKGHG